MDVKIDEITLPFWEHGKTWSTKFITKDEIKTEDIATSSYLKKELWKDVIIIDANLCMYKIEYVNIIKPMGILGWTIKSHERLFIIKKSFVFIKKLTFVDVKQYLIKFIQQCPHIYDRTNELSENRNIIDNIKISNNWNEILESLPDEQYF